MLCKQERSRKTRSIYNFHESTLLRFLIFQIAYSIHVFYILLRKNAKTLKIL